jgi:hypothetical protein
MQEIEALAAGMKAYYSTWSTTAVLQNVGKLLVRLFIRKSSML